VYAHYHNYLRLTRGRPARAGRSSIQYLQDLLLDQALQFTNIFNLFAVSALAQVTQDLFGSLGPQVGANQDRFQVVQRLAVDLFGKCSNLVNLVTQAFTRTRDCFLHLLQEGWLRWSEEGLNHGRPNTRL